MLMGASWVAVREFYPPHQSRKPQALTQTNGTPDAAAAEDGRGIALITR
jgi:hypothetical protein